MQRMIAAAVAALVLGGAAQAGMAEGVYECWAFQSPRMGLNLTVTGSSTYIETDGGAAGEYALNGKDITWLSGHLHGAMPDGFKTIYEVRQGKPTISFIGEVSQSEAAFCEHVG